LANLMDFSTEPGKINILLIDDDQWIRDSMAMYFEEGEYRLVVCETAEEGLDALRNEEYRVVIADYLLPGMDGLEFFKRVRESHPGLLRILITAYGNQKILDEAKAMGVEAVIEKPFTVETVKQFLYRLLQERG